MVGFLALLLKAVASKVAPLAPCSPTKWCTASPLPWMHSGCFPRTNYAFEYVCKRRRLSIIYDISRAQHLSVQEEGIVLRSYQAGEQHSHLACPVCQGGNNNDKDLAVKINPDGRSASWFCHRASCNWKGKVPGGGSRPHATHTSGPRSCTCGVAA